MRRALACLALAAAPLALAEPPPPAVVPIELKVGGTAQIPLHAVGTMFVCDDRTLASVVVEGDHLLLTGLKPGQTRCAWLAGKFAFPTNKQFLLTVRP